MPTTAYSRCRILTDQQLLRLITQKNADAFEVLYDRHAPALYNFTSRFVANDLLAEQVMLDTFAQIWQKAAQYEGIHSVSAWLHEITHNKVLAELRRQNVYPKNDLLAELNYAESIPQQNFLLDENRA